jgi:starch phosphorylase
MPGRPLRTFTVLPHVPAKLQHIRDLAYNLWWSWNPDAVALFRRIDSDLYERVENSPIRMLSETPQSRFEQLEQDDGFLAHLDRVWHKLNDYLGQSTWYAERSAGREEPSLFAYFSMEFGIHECLPIYSGGLGVLAGDHLKSASDLGVPLVGVSLFFRQGYFRQYLNHEGWQQEHNPDTEVFHLPLIPELAPDGSPLMVSVPFPGRELWVRIWRVQVGRVPLYLLDANVSRNTPEERSVTAQLYAGGEEMRIKQEMVLGIGGIRALMALGKKPTVCHMNEGHSAFCSLERMRMMMEEYKLDFATVFEAVKAGTCFTTHTPVPAGNDVFPTAMIEHYLGGYMQSLGIDRHTFLGLGRQNPNDESELFGLTVLALRTSNTSNGVSKLHGDVSRKMWQRLWPGLNASEVPIGSITNGVHTPSWLAPEMYQLYDRYLGFRWQERPAEHDIWRRAERIPDEELWRTHERRRERLVAFARKRVRAQLQRRRATPAEVAAADEVLDPEALTIGFARRFATYKRGTLIFHNSDRLAAIVNNKDRPVQFVFAGKAHPKDAGGKDLIAQIQKFARKPEYRRRIVFLEDYDMNVARTLVEGVDIWLNNPRRPMEASGTSGMKVCGNGGLNFSVLDGWWVEGYKGDNGFAIGAGEDYGGDTETQDEVESRALYDMLEKEIVPMFYKRGSDGTPRDWLRVMKRSISTLTPYFNTNRMVEEYVRLCYEPSQQRYRALTADGLRRAAELAEWRRKVRSQWNQVRVDGVDVANGEALHVGNELEVTARVHLGPFQPDDVELQIYHGPLDSMGEIASAQVEPMGLISAPEGSANGAAMWTYRGRISCRNSGQYGFTVRVLPKHQGLPHVFETGLVTWGQ